MTEVAILQTAERDREAGLSLGRQIRDRLSGAPDAIIVFAAPGNDFQAMLSALAESTDTTTIVGCSSAGEFTNDASGVGLTNATAIRASGMRFTASVGTGLTTDYARAAHDLAGRFQASHHPELPHRAALVLVDALAGHAEEFISALMVETAGSYRFFGGGAGDDARFQQTFVFCGTQVYQNAAVALEIVSKKAIGLGARHGWKPASAPLRVTEADASGVVSLNAAPAIEAFEDHARSTSQKLDRDDPMPFFLHNIVGIDTDAGYKLRVPLGVADSGGVVCAAEIPTGATTHIMATAGASAVEAAAEATRDAVQQVTADGNQPKAALFFDCVATRLRLGKSFEQELDAVATQLDGVPFAGFNSYGQIVRAEGQFSGFHNCTAVVCVLPD